MAYSRCLPVGSQPGENTVINILWPYDLIILIASTFYDCGGSVRFILQFYLIKASIMSTCWKYACSMWFSCTFPIKRIYFNQTKVNITTHPTNHQIKTRNQNTTPHHRLRSKSLEYRFRVITDSDYQTSVQMAKAANLKKQDFMIQRNALKIAFTAMSRELIVQVCLDFRGGGGGL